MRVVNLYPVFETISEQLEELGLKTADKKLEQLKSKYKELQNLLYVIEETYYAKSTGYKKCLLYEKVIEMHSEHIII